MCSGMNVLLAHEIREGRPCSQISPGDAVRGRLPSRVRFVSGAVGHWESGVADQALIPFSSQAPQVCGASPGVVELRVYAVAAEPAWGAGRWLVTVRHTATVVRPALPRCDEPTGRSQLG